MIWRIGRTGNEGAGTRISRIDTDSSTGKRNSPLISANQKAMKLGHCRTGTVSPQRLQAAERRRERGENHFAANSANF